MQRLLYLCAFILVACGNKKAKLIEHRRIAIDALRNDRLGMKTVTQRYELHFISDSEFMKGQSEFFMDSCKWQHYLDSVEDQLAKY